MHIMLALHCRPGTTAVALYCLVFDVEAPSELELSACIYPIGHIEKYDKHSN